MCIATCEKQLFAIVCCLDNPKRLSKRCRIVSQHLIASVNVTFVLQDSAPYYEVQCCPAKEMFCAGCAKMNSGSEFGREKERQRYRGGGKNEQRGGKDRKGLCYYAHIRICHESEYAFFSVHLMFGLAEGLNWSNKELWWIIYVYCIGHRHCGKTVGTVPATLHRVTGANRRGGHRKDILWSLSRGLHEDQYWQLFGATSQQSIFKSDSGSVMFDSMDNFYFLSVLVLWTTPEAFTWGVSIFLVGRTRWGRTATKRLAPMSCSFARLVDPGCNGYSVEIRGILSQLDVCLWWSRMSSPSSALIVFPLIQALRQAATLSIDMSMLEQPRARASLHQHDIINATVKKCEPVFLENLGLKEEVFIDLGQKMSHDWHCGHLRPRFQGFSANQACCKCGGGQATATKHHGCNGLSLVTGTLLSVCRMVDTLIMYK